MNKEDLQKSLAGKQTESTFKITDDCFLINVKTVSYEVETAFQLLFAHLMDQAYRKEAFNLAMKRFDQQYDMLNHSIEGAMILHGKRFLAGGDSRFGLPPQEEFNRLSLQDVVDWIEPSLQKDALEVSLVGDFDVESVVLLASRYLGTLAKREVKEKKMISLSPGFPSGKSLILPVDTRIPKALVVVSYSTDDIWDIAKTRRFSVLSEIFSERMRKEIREKLGATYSPYAYHHPSRAYKGFGALYAVVETDPSSVNTVVTVIKKIAGDLSQSGILKEELQFSVRPLLTGIKDLIRNNDYWLNTVLSGSAKHPEQLDWSRTIVGGYSSVTREEISAMARQYLDSPKSAVVKIVGERGLEKGKRE
jgi:zinc protease